MSRFPERTDPLAAAVREAIAILADAKATSVPALRQRQQRAHVVLWTALERHESTASRRRAVEGR